MGYVLGLDLGTSSLKGLLINKQGEVVETATSSYSLSHPQSGYSEQNPADWLRACDEVIAELVNNVKDFTNQLEGISFSGQMHSLVLLDKNYEVLRPAILWNDVRNAAECQLINDDFGQEIVKITKNIAREGFTLPKILWVQRHEPHLWEQVSHILLPKDYLRWYLTDTFNMDYSDAAGTLLLDIAEKSWSKEICDKYEIDMALLPPLIASSKVVSEIKMDLKQQYGFDKSVQVIAGGADNACAAIGAGILDSSIGMASVGTSGVFLSYEESVHDNYHGDLHLFNHAVDDAHYSMGVTLAAGHSLNWFKSTFLPDKSFDDALANIESIPIGSDGLLFAPYIVGERTPHTDSLIRGSFIGIDTNHTIDHFVRSVIEGITFSLKDSQHLMEKVANKQFTKIVSVGGGAHNKAWLQIQADIFGTNITTLAADQGPGLGAAMLAAMGIGWFNTIEDCHDVFGAYTEVVQPVSENVEKYASYYNLYQQMYQTTKDMAHALQELKSN